MLAFVGAYLLRNVATTTLVSALTLVVTMYKFKLRLRDSSTRNKAARKVSRNPRTWLSLSSKKSTAHLQRTNTRETRVAAILCALLEQTTDIELQLKLCSLQDHITRFRRILHATDYCLAVLQERLALIQGQLQTLGYRQPQSDSNIESSLALQDKSHAVRKLSAHRRFLKLTRSEARVRD